MPAQQDENFSLSKLLGDRGRRVHAAAAEKETDWGMASLPPGIKGGLAQLTRATYSKYKPGTKLEGKPYVSLTGTAITPKSHGGIKVEGKIVSLMIPLCDTPDRKAPGGLPGTFENWYESLLNEFRKLGVVTRGTGIDDLEAILKLLTETKPHFTYNTRGWTPKPTEQNPEPDTMVFTEFTGAVNPDDHATDPTEETQDDTAFDDGAQTEPTPEPTKSKPQTNGTHKQPATSSEKMPNMVAKAEAGDMKAQDYLMSMARDAGATEQEINDAADWAGVLALSTSNASTQAGREGDDEQTESKNPKVGKVYHFRPLDKRTRKPVSKPVEVKVTEVDEDNGTVDLEDTDDADRTWSGVKWERLEEVS